MDISIFGYMFGFCFTTMIACFFAIAILSCIYYLLAKAILKTVRRVMRVIRRIRRFKKHA